MEKVVILTQSEYNDILVSLRNIEANLAEIEPSYARSKIQIELDDIMITLMGSED